MVKNKRAKTQNLGESIPYEEIPPEKEAVYKKIIQLVEENIDNLVLEMVKDQSQNTNFCLKGKKQEMAERQASLRAKGKGFPVEKDPYADHGAISFFKTSDDEEKFFFNGDVFVYSQIKDFITKIKDEQENNSGATFLQRVEKFFSTENTLDALLKDMPEEIKHSKFISGVSYDKQKGDTIFINYSIQEVLEQSLEEGCVLSVGVDEKGKLSKVAKALIDKGKILLPRSEDYDYDPQESILELFMPYQNADQKYHLPSYKDELSMDEKSQQFINDLRKIVKDSPLNRHIGMVVYGADNNRAMRMEQQAYYVRDLENYGKSGKKLFKVERSKKERIQDFFTNRYTLILNHKHNFVQKAISTAAVEDYAPVVYSLLLSSISYNLTTSRKKLPKKMETFINSYFSNADRKPLDLSDYKKKFLVYGSLPNFDVNNIAGENNEQ